MEKDYQKAIKIVNDIIVKDPKFYEAMLIKAQILHEGFSNTDSAKKHLEIIVEKAKPGKSIHTWASSLYDELSFKTE